MDIGDALRLCVVILCLRSVKAEWYDTFTGNQITDARLAALRLNNLIPWCAVEVNNCTLDEPRRSDFSCNNIHYPSRGASMTPYHHMLPPDFPTNGGLRTAKSGKPLPNARALRVALVPDGRIPNNKYTNLLTNMAVFITGDSSSVHDTFNYVVLTITCCLPGGELNPRCMPITVPDDDMHLRRSNVRCLNLTRTITYQSLGCIPETLPPERVNLFAPMLDLSHVYGSDAGRAIFARERWGGRLRGEKLKGKDWPPGNSPLCLQNNINETRCHRAAEPAINALISANMAFLWFMRQHNNLAERLAKVNPCWDDDKLYIEARDINIAIWQQIAYYDLMPNIVDYRYLLKNGVIFPDHGHVDDYDPSLEPRVSIDYAVATRWFHVLQEGKLNLYDNHGKILRQLGTVDLVLHTGVLPQNNTIEGLTQGSFRQPCASTDKVIDPDMGERVLGRLQFASDIMSTDIMKGRDHGLPSYNRYRELCKLPVAHDFEDLYHWLPHDQVESMQMLYEDVEDIELMAGILSEVEMGDGVVGETLACIIVDQLLRWRRADRFWYENTVHPGAFTPEQLYEIRKMTMSKLLCDHGDAVDAVQPNAFQLPRPGNEIISCSEYSDMNIDEWRDNSCNVKQGKTQMYVKQMNTMVPRGREPQNFY
ncbi:unnamed protein product [Diatraea saccharalis]|uniref:Peroxidase n=1 Tax=Diatraea saccharalis TaxID=40085 RepID=A0A9N9R4I0_9NEOP|nr:unnamed protein product [Diatraea saccharalis]